MMLLSHVSDIITVSEELKQAIISVSQKKIFTKNQIILGSGEKCNDIFFVENGFLRGYYIDDDWKEITNWFAQENEFATCFYSFIAKQPSFEIIQAYSLLILNGYNIFGIRKHSKTAVIL